MKRRRRLHTGSHVFAVIIFPYSGSRIMLWMAYTADFVAAFASNMLFTTNKVRRRQEEDTLATSRLSSTKASAGALPQLSSPPNCPLSFFMAAFRSFSSRFATWSLYRRMMNRDLIANSPLLTKSDSSSRPTSPDPLPKPSDRPNDNFVDLSHQFHLRGKLAGVILINADGINSPPRIIRW